MKKIHMLADRLLVQRLEAEEKTKAGIIIPETAKEEQTKGKVIAVGSGKRLSSGKIQALEVEKGDTVIFGKYAGSDIKIDDRDFTILHEDDVLAKLEE